MSTPVLIICTRTGKRCHAVRRLALQDGKPGLRAYRCEFCGTWHTTSKPLRVPNGC